MCINVLLASLLKDVSEADQKCLVMKGSRCTWINLPELLDSADKHNLLCQLCQHIAQFLSRRKKKGNQNPGSHSYINLNSLFINVTKQLPPIDSTVSRLGQFVKYRSNNH